MNRHVLSTIAWVVLFVFAAGFYAGMVFGVVTSPAAYDARTIQQHLRMVFCEQAIRNKLVNTCEVD